jgi:hypothetical protein
MRLKNSIQVKPVVTGGGGLEDFGGFGGFVVER